MDGAEKGKPGFLEREPGDPDMVWQVSMVSLHNMSLKGHIEYKNLPIMSKKKPLQIS